MNKHIPAILERLKAESQKACKEAVSGIKTFFYPCPPDAQASALTFQPAALGLPPSASPSVNGRYIPVIITTAPDLPPLWGRLTRLWPEGAELTSKFEIQKGRIAALRFELGGNEHSEIRALLSDAAKDRCGYFVYKLAFKDPCQIAALSAEIRKADFQRPA